MNPGAAVTVNAICVVAESPPELPLMVTVVGPPAVAPAVADRVRVLLPVAGLGLNEALTPAGKPEAENVTAPANPFAGITVSASVPVPPCVSDRVAPAAETEKLGAGLTVTGKLADALSAPEMPVMVTRTGPPTGAALDADRVKTLEPVAGLVAKTAVTPAGSPLAERVTPPENPFAGVTVTVLVTLLPWITAALAGCTARVKPGGDVTVSAMVAVAVAAPEVPVMVSVVPDTRAAVADAVNVSTLEAVAGVPEKEADTPAGSPVAARETPPANPPWLVIRIVTVALPP